MKRITQGIAIIFFCFFFTFNISASPKATISQNSFNFGFAPQGAKLSHKYWIHSTGDEELKIVKVVPGCGCTKAPLEKDIISSGDSTWLEIIFSTKKYKSKINKRPKFFTNESESANYVSFTADVVGPNVKTSPLEISPFKINLTQQNLRLAKSSTNEVGEFTVTNSSAEELMINIIEYDKNFIEVKFPKTIKAGETVSGKIIRNSENNMTFYKSVTIEVNDEKKTRFTIPIEYKSDIISQK